jgi:hypothetical protein
VVANHSDEQRNGDEQDRDDPAVSQSKDELAQRNDRLSAMLEMRKYAFHWSPDIPASTTIALCVDQILTK